VFPFSVPVKIQVEASYVGFGTNPTSALFFFFGGSFFFFSGFYPLVCILLFLSLDFYSWFVFWGRHFSCSYLPLFIVFPERFLTH